MGNASPCAAYLPQWRRSRLDPDLANHLPSLPLANVTLVALIPSAPAVATVSSLKLIEKP